MRRRLLALVAILVLVVTAAAAPAGADTAVPLTGFSRIAVDGAHSHVFLSGGTGDAELAVMNADGTADTTVSLAAGADAMAISGNTLYAAECGAGKIEEIDTATLTVSGSIASTIGGGCDMVFAAGRLWYANSAGHLLSIDPTAGSPTEVDSGVTSVQMLAASSALPNQLVWANTSGVTLESVDSSGTATQQAHASSGLTALQDVAVNGKTVSAADANQSQILLWSLPNLTSQPPRALQAHAHAVAASANGAYVAGGGVPTTTRGADVYLSGSSTVANFATLAAGTQVEPRGLAFSADNLKFYVVTATQANSTQPTLKVIKASNLPGNLTITRSKTPITNGAAVTVTAHLGTASTNRKVNIWRRVVGGTTWRLTKTGTVGTSGKLSFTARPKYTTYYYASWAGDATHGQTKSAAVGIAVHLVMTVATQGGYATQAGVRLYHFTTACEKASHAGCPRFVGGSKPLTPGVVMNVLVQARANGGWHAVLQGHTNAGKGGKLILTIFYRNRSLVGVPQRIRFSIARTAHNLGNTSAWKQFRITN